MTEDYETVELDLDDKTLMLLFKRAHEADVTLNQYLERVIRSAIVDAHLQVADQLEERGDDLSVGAARLIRDYSTGEMAFLFSESPGGIP